MRNQYIAKSISRARLRAVLLTLAISAPTFFVSGMSFRAHTQRAKVEDAYIRSMGANTNLKNSQSDKIIQDARDKINKSRGNK